MYCAHVVHHLKRKGVASHMRKRLVVEGHLPAEDKARPFQERGGGSMIIMQWIRTILHLGAASLPRTSEGPKNAR